MLSLQSNLKLFQKWKKNVFFWEFKLDWVFDQVIRICKWSYDISKIYEFCVGRFFRRFWNNFLWWYINLLHKHSEAQWISFYLIETFLKNNFYFKPQKRKKSVISKSYLFVLFSPDDITNELSSIAMEKYWIKMTNFETEIFCYSLSVFIDVLSKLPLK